MLTVRLTAMAIGLILGVVVGTICPAHISAPAWLVLVLSVAGLVVSALLSVRERRWRKTPYPLVIAAALLCTAPIGCLRVRQKIGPPRAGSLRHALDGIDVKRSVYLRGTIAAEPELRVPRHDPTRVYGDFRIKVAALKTAADAEWVAVRPGNVNVRVYPGRSAAQTESDQLRALTHPRAYGWTVQIRARLQDAAPPANPGGFNLRSFLLQNDLVAQCRCFGLSNVQITDTTRGNPLTELALLAKEHFLGTYRRTVRSPASRLAAGATLGTRRALEGVRYGDFTVEEMFRRAGVGHVLAVSGLHVSIIAVLLYSLFALTPLKPRAFAPVVVFALVLFALLTGARPATVRATVMNIAVIIPLAYWRFDLRRATAIGLSVSVIFLLTVNPVVLYSPSFLLSYGAVLSLILLTPCVDRWLGMLTGAALAFAALWFAGLLALTFIDMGLLIGVPNVLALAGCLWLLILAGIRVNARYPALCRIGLNRLPRAVRMLIVAQFAIQFGMMVPLNSWFFGRFPVAGVLVNLLAIPLVGILVQIAMVTGLAGLVPVVGAWLAAPLGAATTVIGDLFLAIAGTAAELFPYPTTPKPSLRWLALYYGIVALAVYLERWRRPLLARTYALWQSLERPERIFRAAYTVPCLMVLTPLLAALTPRPQKAAELTLFHTRDYPVAALAAHNPGRAALLNAGDAFVAGNIVFNSLRAQGIRAVDEAILCSVEPDAGLEGAAALAAILSIGRCHVPVTPHTPAEYLQAIDDSYLLKNLEAGKPWAQAYITAYEQFHETLTESGCDPEQTQPGECLFDWGSARVTALPAVEPMPRMFVNKARSTLLAIELSGFHILLVSDAHPDAVESALEGRRCDILVLPQDNYPKRKGRNAAPTGAGSSPRSQRLSIYDYYRTLVDGAVAETRPQIVIFCGEYGRSFQPQEWARQHPQIRMLETSVEGALVISPLSEHRLQMRGHSSGTCTVLTRQDALQAATPQTSYARQTPLPLDPRTDWHTKGQVAKIQLSSPCRR